MKLSDLKLHLTGQNKFNMESPPINERDFVSLIKQHSRIINKVSYFYGIIHILPQYIRLFRELNSIKE